MTLRRRFFNTTGPCHPEMHYMLPPEERLMGAQLARYIRDQLYWVLHAPRQTGKTTFLQSWMREINAGSEAVSCYVSVERCQGVPEVDRAIPAICDAIRDAAEKVGLPVPEQTAGNAISALNDILTDWAKLVNPKPLVVLFDEVDVLVDEALISFLRQLRGGFASRGVGRFPVSIALVGMRDLKDYISKAKDGKPVNPGSPFNIKADSAVIGNFGREAIARLFAQRTAETGQQITAEALNYVWEQSKGQPWLVNSLFKRATMRILDEDSTETVTIEHIRQAREQMIQARETHLDALAVRL
ncbi:MAG: AAA family ATPase, partial [Bacteroidales bacterium]|nr:AAA family ATPase [Bacteroidales bacterium]